MAKGTAEVRDEVWHRVRELAAEVGWLTRRQDGEDGTTTILLLEPSDSREVAP